MTPEKVRSIVEMYEDRLRACGAPKTRMHPTRTFASLTREEMLAHAHYLCNGVKEYCQDPARQGKTGRHLTAIQMCLSFAGWYTLAELMEHNRQ